MAGMTAGVVGNVEEAATKRALMTEEVALRLTGTRLSSCRRGIRAAA